MELNKVKLTCVKGESGYLKWHLRESLVKSYGIPYYKTLCGNLIVEELARLEVFSLEEIQNNLCEICLKSFAKSYNIVASVVAKEEIFRGVSR